MDIILIVSVGIALLLVISWLVLRQTNRSASTDVAAPVDRPRYSKLVFGDEQHPLAVIERFEPTTTIRHEVLPLSEGHLSRLNAIFQHAPSLASSALVATSNTYVLRFAPDVARDIANGSLQVMQSAEGGLRGIAVNVQGKIVAHGTLIPASSATLTAATTAIWHGLAILTAQHYLPQIDRRLLQIERGIDELKAYLEARDVATLLSGLKELKSIKLLAEKADFQEAALLAAIISLDAIDHDCGCILETYRILMSRYAADFDALPLASLFNVDFASAKDKLTRYQKAEYICLQAIYVKVVASQLRCAIPSDRRIAHHRLQELEADLAAWYAEQASFVRRFRERIQDDTTPAIHLDSLKNLFGIGGTFTEYQQEIISEANRIQNTIIVLYDELHQIITEFIELGAKQLSPPSQPFALTVKLNEQNQIELVSRLIES